MVSRVVRVLNLEEESLVGAGMDSCHKFGIFDVNKVLRELNFETIDSKQEVILRLDNDKRRNGMFRNCRRDTYGVPYTYGVGKTKSKRCQFFNW